MSRRGRWTPYCVRLNARKLAVREGSDPTLLKQIESSNKHPCKKPILRRPVKKSYIMPAVEKTKQQDIAAASEADDSLQASESLADEEKIRSEKSLPSPLIPHQNLENVFLERKIAKYRKSALEAGIHVISEAGLKYFDLINSIDNSDKRLKDWAVKEVDFLKQFGYGKIVVKSRDSSQSHKNEIGEILKKAQRSGVKVKHDPGTNLPSSSSSKCEPDTDDDVADEEEEEGGTLAESAAANIKAALAGRSTPAKKRVRSVEDEVRDKKRKAINALVSGIVQMNEAMPSAHFNFDGKMF